MFTGIVQELGTVDSLELASSGGRLTVRAPKLAPRLSVDESVATNGVCLTVVACDGSAFTADLAPETLGRTNLGQLRPGSRVCLERSVTLETPLGGHLVQGHVDGLATLVERAAVGIQTTLRFEAPPHIARYVVEKGFIALDGVSLTVASCHGSAFGIALIPHSAELTTLGAKRVGESVNVEVDLFAKYIERFLDLRAAGAANG